MVFLTLLNIICIFLFLIVKNEQKSDNVTQVNVSETQTLSGSYFNIIYIIYDLPTYILFFQIDKSIPESKSIKYGDINTNNAHETEIKSLNVDGTEIDKSNKCENYNLVITALSETYPGIYILLI